MIPILGTLITDGIRYKNDFTILIILTDELKFSHENSTFVESIRILANLPNACLLIIGIGDGPWHRISLEEQCLRASLVKSKNLPKSFPENYRSKFIYDNFHFVNFNSYTSKSDSAGYDINFARAVFTKLPTQLKQTCRHKKQNDL